MSQPDELLETQVGPELRDAEVSEADAAEQALTAGPADPTRPRAGVTTLAFEANEYDAIEQDRVVEYDDDYR